MQKGNRHFYNHFFIYLLIVGTVIVGLMSFYRFMEQGDYVVSYEGVCDSSVESCFTGCKDDACTQIYYYSKMQKFAPDLYKECGEDITDCEEASMCLLSDHKCSVIYCDTKAGDDTCSESIEQPSLPSDNNGSVETSFLQDSNLDNIRL